MPLLRIEFPSKTIKILGFFFPISLQRVRKSNNIVLQVISDDFCKYNHIDGTSWCATKLDNENQIAERSLCPDPLENFEEEDEEGSGCKELKCDMDMFGGKLQNFNALNRFYKASLDKLTFEGAIEFCAQNGAFIANIPEFSDTLLYYLNQALVDQSEKLETKDFWLGYKFFNKKLYPVKHGTNEHESEKAMQYEVESDGENNCIVGIGTENSYFGELYNAISGNVPKPTMATAYCKANHQVLCMKSCHGSIFFCLNVSSS